MPTAPSKPRTAARDLQPDDAVCRKCRYSLAGLPSGGVCPECGTPIVRGRKRHYLDESMTDAPVHYLKWLAAGCWAMAISGCATMILGLTAFRTSDLVWCGITGAAGLLWLAGVVLVTRARETTARASADLKREWRLLRPISRISAAGWSLSALMYAGLTQATQAAITNAAIAGTAYAPTPEVIALTIASAGFVLLGLCGLVPLSIILVDLCDWAGDGTLSERLRLAASGIAFGSLAVMIALPAFLLILTGPLRLIVCALLILGTFCFFGGYLFFLFCTIQLAGMSLWAVSNSITAIERDERVAAKKAEHAEEMVNRVLRTQASTAIPAPPRPALRKPAPASGPRPAPTAAPKPQSRPQPKPGSSKPPTGGNPYDLAPEEP